MNDPIVEPSARVFNWPKLVGGPGDGKPVADDLWRSSTAKYHAPALPGYLDLPGAVCEVVLYRHELLHIGTRPGGRWLFHVFVAEGSTMLDAIDAILSAAVEATGAVEL